MPGYTTAPAEDGLRAVSYTHLDVYKRQLVLYAGETDLTLHIGREDEFFGYVLHIDGVCTDPELLALYRQLHALSLIHI